MGTALQAWNNGRSSVRLRKWLQSLQRHAPLVPSAVWLSDSAFQFLHVIDGRMVIPLHFYLFFIKTDKHLNKEKIPSNISRLIVFLWGNSFIFLWIPQGNIFLLLIDYKNVKAVIPTFYSKSINK